MDRSMLVALVDEVLDAQAGPQSEVVFLPESEDAGDGQAAPFPLFIEERNRPASGRFQSSLGLGTGGTMIPCPAPAVAGV